jgi:hypothetical protein
VTEWTTDGELGAALIDLGAQHDTRRAVWPLWAVAAAVIAVIAIAIVSIAPARHAVADLLGIGATHVQHVDRLPSTEESPPLPSNGDWATLAKQLARHHLFALDPALVGDPVAWRVDPQDDTVVAYEDVALSQRPLAGAGPSIKRYGGGANVQFVQVGNEPAVYVGGEHTRTIAGHTFRSGSALIWDFDGVELRLEGDVPLDQMLTIARSARRAG